MTTVADPHAVENQAFPKLTAEDLEILGKHATCRTFRDGEVVFHAGDADVDLFVVESGAIDILNPTDGDRLIATHEAGEFAGDIDLLTRRPVIVTAVARGPRTHVLCIPGNKLREVLNTIPHISEILITAFTMRRQQLQKAGVLGLKVVGPKSCRDTTVVREFLYKNFVPFTWFDMEQEAGKRCGSRWFSEEDTRDRVLRWEGAPEPHAARPGRMRRRLARLPGERSRGPRGRRRRARRPLPPPSTRRVKGSAPSSSTASAPAGRSPARRWWKISSASPPACPARTWRRAA
jgi:CRP-like cAMP-binding protein